MGATEQSSLLYLLQASIMTSSRNSGAKERAGEVRAGLQRGPLLRSPPGLPSSWLTNAGHRYSSLEDVHGAIHGRLDTGERTGGGHRGLGGRVQAQSGGCDEAQGSLRAHKEPGEVVASCALPGPRGHR